MNNAHAQQSDRAGNAGQSLNIGADRVAKVYAQAIVEAADREHCRREVLDELGGIVDGVLQKVPQARVFFASPKVTPEEKGAIIDRMAKGRVLPTTLHALQVVARHERLDILAEVVAAARRLSDTLDGRRQAVFTTAVPLDAAEQERIVAEVSKSLGITLAPTFVVDPDMLGGLVVRVDDTVYDQSVATSLVRLGDRLKQRSIRAIQNREFKWEA
jgi:F-type H+-transporting ATPase subunit delta